MRSRSRSRRRAKTHRRHRVKTHRRSFRGRGGAITAQELRNRIQRIPVHLFAGNEEDFRNKSFEEAKEWFKNTFQQVEHPQLWKDALWPNHAQADPTNVMTNILDDEKKENKSGFWTAKSGADRITEFVVPFIKERIRKVESEVITVGRTVNGIKRFAKSLFSSEDIEQTERLEKLIKDTASIRVFLKALIELSEQFDMGTNIVKSNKEGFSVNIFQLDQTIRGAQEAINKKQKKKA